MAWLMIVAAGLFEIVMAYSLKLSEGFGHPLPTAGFAVSAVLSFGLLALALKILDVGTAYSLWTGIGAVGTAIVGMAVLGENASLLKIASIALIVTGIAGLNLAGGHTAG